jgi:hypothetical protein
MTAEQWREHADNRFNAQDRDLRSIKEMLSLWRFGKYGWNLLVGLAIFGAAAVTLAEKMRLWLRLHKHAAILSAALTPPTTSQLAGGQGVGALNVAVPAPAAPPSQVAALKAGATAMPTDQEKRALLALSWLPGPVGNKFEQRLANESFGGDQVATAAYIGKETNYIWNAALNQALAGVPPDQIVAKLKKHTNPDTQSDVPTVDDIAVMVRLYNS